ncbi:unnamed protein product, partial [Durusdinium trenchii]
PACRCRRRTLCCAPGRQKAPGAAASRCGWVVRARSTRGSAHFKGGPSRSSLGTSSAALAPWRLEQRHRPGGTVSGCWSGCRSE